MQNIVLIIIKAHLFSNGREKADPQKAAQGLFLGHWLHPHTTHTYTKLSSNGLVIVQQNYTVAIIKVPFKLYCMLHIPQATHPQITCTMLDFLLLEYSPTHLLEVVEIQGQSLITLLVEVGQLSEPGPVVFVSTPVELHTIESYHTAKVQLFSFGPSNTII